MKLDKSHLTQFENISPPMREALTLPVMEQDVFDAGAGRETGCVVYVCASTFATLDKRDAIVRRQVAEIAAGLAFVSPRIIERVKNVLTEGASYDDEHDALVALYEAITGEEAPQPSA